MKLHLVRHGETDINASGRLQGTTNSTLTPRGRAQARELAVASLTWNPVAVYSSPLQRARGVAGAIADLSGLSVTDEPRIIEMDMGDLEGVTVQEMRDGWPDLYQGWRRDASSVTMPGGESLGDVHFAPWRLSRNWTSVTTPKTTIIAVTHNFTIRCIVAAVIDLPSPTSITWTCPWGAAPPSPPDDAGDGSLPSTPWTTSPPPTAPGY